MTDEEVDENARRRPGRPPKKRQVDVEEEYVEQSTSRRQGRSAISYESSLSSRHEFPPPETSRRASTSPGKSSRSPSKRGQISLDRQIPEAAIDMKYLSRCNPAVRLTNFRELKQAQKRISSLVGDLHQRLGGVPLGLIPFALEVCFSLFLR